MPFQIVKVDQPQQVVYGWANVSATPDGELVTDRQDDIIEPAELERAAIQFMLDSRSAGVMHKGAGVGDVVASLVTTPDVVKALFGESAATAAIPVGWLIGVKFEDVNVFKRIVRGELKAFSIQGTAERVPVAA